MAMLLRPLILTRTLFNMNMDIKQLNGTVFSSCSWRSVPSERTSLRSQASKSADGNWLGAIAQMISYHNDT